MLRQLLIKSILQLLCICRVNCIVGQEKSRVSPLKVKIYNFTFETLQKPQNPDSVAGEKIQQNYSLNYKFKDFKFTISFIKKVTGVNSSWAYLFLVYGQSFLETLKIWLLIFHSNNFSFK